ncbi:hypothetical protein EW145_g5819, partial [Phellinidium pouzarii]
HVSVGTFTLEPYTSWTPSLAILILNDHNHFTHLTPNKAAHILRTFPLLIQYSVYINTDIHDLPFDLEQLEPIEHIHLKSLAISWEAWIDPGLLLDSLSTPSLQSLGLAAGSQYLEMEDRPHLSNFLQRSRPPLLDLILERFECDHGLLLQALSWTPNLERLWLERCMLDDIVIRGLYSSGNGVLRTLKTLILDKCFGFYHIEVFALVLKEHASANGGNPSVKVHLNKSLIIDPGHILLLEEMSITNIEFGDKNISLDMIDKLGRMIIVKEHLSSN